MLPQLIWALGMIRTRRWEQVVQVGDLNVSTCQVLTPRRVPGCKRQKRLLEPRVLPAVLRRGYIHGKPAFLTFSASITYIILVRFSNAVTQPSSPGLPHISPPT